MAARAGGSPALIRVVVLGSGSRGNCTLVQVGETRVLIDAGFSRRETARRLRDAGERLEDIDAILVTHEHSDHVGGARAIARKHQIPVACHEDTAVHARLSDGEIPEWIPIEPGKAFDIGALHVEPFIVPHDALTTLGFRITGEGLAVGYCTDLGHVTPLVRQRLSSTNVLILESNHDLDMLREGTYPWSLKQRVGGRHGHLSNEASADLLGDVVDGEILAVGLAHLSQANNLPDLALAHARGAMERCGRERVPLIALAQDRITDVARA